MLINNTLFQAELHEILNELQAQLQLNGIDLLSKTKDNNDNIQVTCPYHNNGQERRPSAGIHKDTGVFHCFACNETHTLPEVISFCFGYTDDILGKYGWKWLLKNFLTLSIEERKDVDLDFKRPNRSVRSGRNNGNDNRSGDNLVSNEELDSYRYIHPYMYERGLTDDIIELFDVGYDKKTDCITFPVRDIKGNCLFIARRSVRTKYFNYPKGVDKPLYGLYELYLSLSGGRGSAKTNIKPLLMLMIGEIIVCESMLDALSFWTVGKYAVALNGLGNDLQFKQLRELPCRKIILATDMDERGLNARERIKHKLQGRKLVMQYMFPEGRKDANECTKDELKNLQEVF